MTTKAESTAWRTIDTAPKDTLILLKGGHCEHYYDEKFIAVCEWDRFGCWCIHGSGEIYREATHWAHLPK